MVLYKFLKFLCVFREGRFFFLIIYEFEFFDFIGRVEILVIDFI